MIREVAASSSALYCSASLTIRSMSSFESRPLSLVMVILFDFPVVLSAAETFKIPLASISKVTSTWGTPRYSQTKFVSFRIRDDETSRRNVPVPEEYQRARTFRASCCLSHSASSVVEFKKNE